MCVCVCRRTCALAGNALLTLSATPVFLDRRLSPTTDDDDDDGGYTAVMARCTLLSDEEMAYSLPKVNPPHR